MKEPALYNWFPLRFPVEARHARQRESVSEFTRRERFHHGNYLALRAWSNLRRWGPLHRLHPFRSRPPGRHRTPWSARRWATGPSGIALRFAVVAVTLCVSLAYGGGISYGHWITAALADVAVNTGSLSVVVEDLETEFDFTCQTHLFPRYALSFVRFWAPGQDPGDLKARDIGAVKIEEDGSEATDGYSIEPPDAAIGDPAVVHLGSAVVTITDWIENPGEPGEYLGFTYLLELLEGDPVVVDVNAARSIWRTTLDVSGLWSLDGMGDPTARPLHFCHPSSIESVIPVTNDGSVPATPHIVLGPAIQCELFEVTLGVSGEVLAAGPLCDLLEQPFQISPQLDPGDSTFATLSISLAETELDEGEYTAQLSVTGFVTQWNFPLEGAGLGWTAASTLPLNLTVNVEPPDYGYGVCDGEGDCPVAEIPVEEGSLEEGPVEEGPVEEPPVEETPAEEPATEETPVEEPPADELPVVEPPAEEPPVQENPADEPPDEDPPPDGPPIDGVHRASLAGLVWNDLDDDGLAVLGGPEDGLSGVEVVLLDEFGFEVEMVETMANGFYLFPDVEPGTYVVGFYPPQGFGFADLGEPAEPFDSPEEYEIFLAGLADEMDVEPEELVLCDLVELDEQDGPLIGLTAPVVLADGENLGLGDAALIEVEEPQGAEEPAIEEAPPEPIEIPETPTDPPSEPGEDSSINPANPDGDAKEPEPDPVKEALVSPANPDGDAKEPESDSVGDMVPIDSGPDDGAPTGGEIPEVPPADPVDNETTP